MTRMQTRIRRRTGVLVTLVAASTASAGSLASLASLTACSSAGPVPGWEKAQDGGLRLIVPSGWDKTVPQSSLWSTRWTDPADKSSVLMTAQSVSAADAYQALDLAPAPPHAATCPEPAQRSPTAVPLWPGRTIRPPGLTRTAARPGR